MLNSYGGSCILRDKSHMEQVERWAEYVRNNPDWKKKHTKFIDAQFDIANRFYKKLALSPGGKEKIEELRKVKVNG
jgi:hypothetical protein